MQCKDSDFRRTDIKVVWMKGKNMKRPKIIVVMLGVITGVLVGFFAFVLTDYTWLKILISIAVDVAAIVIIVKNTLR